MQQFTVDNHSMDDQELHIGLLLADRLGPLYSRNIR